MVPFAKTGGLADVTGSLPEAIRALGHEVIPFVPRYKGVDIQKWGLQSAVDRLEVPLGAEHESARIFSHTLKSGMKVLLVDHPEFFCRDGLYGTPLGDYPDNDRRFIFFQRAVCETLIKLGIKADVIHCHDWQTGLIPVYLKTLYAGEALFKKTKSVFTIHNLAYQGNFPPDSLPATGLGWDQFKMERLEFYGKVSFLKAALVYADMVTTVSERYAEEIQTKEFGCGMEGILSRRRETLRGIVNGVDPKEWNPETDTDIAAQYQLRKIDKKWINKNALQKENNMKVDTKTPLVGIIARLVDQKGIDILIPAIGEMARLGAQFVLLGTGDEKYHQVLREVAKKGKGKVGIHILFDAKMAKRMYAGCDMMLVPSYYEPCGLGQLIALRFGTLPIVRATGGLADTIQEFNPETGEGNGFVFEDYTSEALLGAVARALRTFQDEKSWLRLVKNAMESDFSWAASAKKYVQLFEMTEQRSTSS